MAKVIEQMNLLASENRKPINASIHNYLMMKLRFFPPLLI